MSRELPQDKKPDADPVNPDRRRVLKACGRFAVYVSPAMTVLLPGKADAWHKPGHTGGCQSHPESPYCSQA